jgi:hypothetical protein
MQTSDRIKVLMVRPSLLISNRPGINLRLKYYFMWKTQYSYQGLQGDIALRLRELIKEGCAEKGMEVVRGNRRANPIHIEDSPNFQVWDETKSLSAPAPMSCCGPKQYWTPHSAVSPV